MRLTPDRTVPSIRRRMLWLLMPGLALVLAVNVWTDMETSTEPTREAYDQALADTAVAIAAHVQYRDGVFSLGLPPQAAMALHSSRFDQIYYLVRDPRGQIVSGSADLPPAPHSIEQSPAYYGAEYLGKRVRVVVYRSATPGGEVVVQVAQTTRRRDQLAARFVTMDALQDLLLVAATLLLVYFGVRFGLAPLTRLREDLEKRTAEDLRPVDEAQIPSEVKPLVQALNRLLRLLRASSEAQQRFLANAAHQLRTPLAGLQTQLELANNEHDPEQLKQRLRSLQDSASRLVRMTNQVLALARAEPSASLLQGMRTVDLRDVVEASASTYLDRALAKNIDIGFEAKPALIHGSDWLAKELTANLVENALAYTPCGGQVTVRCGTRGAEAYLEVEDSGPGIPEAERERVFERFYRLPESPGEGSGLGLAIVREIAQVHRAQIRLDNPQTGGTRIEVSFASTQ
jgi:two-component system sensor histidine kinase TctE